MKRRVQLRTAIQLLSQRSSMQIAIKARIFVIELIVNACKKHFLKQYVAGECVDLLDDFL